MDSYPPVVPGQKSTYTRVRNAGATSKTSADVISKVLVPSRDNLRTGTFHVEGAEPGGTLAIRLLSVTPARSYAVSAFSPGFGAMVSNEQTEMLDTELPEAVWRSRR